MSEPDTFESVGIPDSFDVSLQKSTALSNKITSVLSASFVDTEIRTALQSLNGRKFQNTPESRRRLHVDVRKEVIDRNGDIIRDFGEVAEVR